MAKAQTRTATPPAPEAAVPAPETPSPIPASPQVSEPTGAEGVLAAASAASVDPLADAGPVAFASPFPIVTVKGPEKGRWRAGLHFGPVPVELALADLSADAIDALKADTELTCIWPEA